MAGLPLPGTGKNWGQQTQTERFADIVGAKEAQIRIQVEVITRLMAAVAMRDVSVRGTVVRFKISPEVTQHMMEYAIHPGQGIPYLTLDETVKPTVSEVDGRTVITVTLKPFGA